jgi:hypothetical protein
MRAAGEDSRAGMPGTSSRSQSKAAADARTTHQIQPISRACGARLAWRSSAMQSAMMPSIWTWPSALRCKHVNFADRIVHVRANLSAGSDQEDTPKSGRSRSVPLSDQALVALDGLSRREYFTGEDDLVFGNAVGKHLSDCTARDGFYAALDAAELGHLRSSRTRSCSMT